MAQDELEKWWAEDKKPSKSPEPPKPRAAGTDSHAQDEDKLVAQIEAENKKDEPADEPAQPEQPMVVIGDKKAKKPAFFKRAKFWWWLILLLLLAGVFVWLVTPSRLWLLNMLGLRAEVTVTAAVATNEGEPPLLKNTQVVVNGQAYHTDDSGKVRVLLPYGPVHIEATKAGYESITKDYLLDFDPFFHLVGGAQADAEARNPVLLMKNVGVVVGFLAKDWLSGLPVTQGAFSVGDVVAHPSAEGKVFLGLPATDEKTVVAMASFEAGYTNKQVELVVGDTTQEVAFVPAGNHYFISKRSGQYAVYSSKLDGSEVAELVPQAAAETGDIAFSASPDGAFGVLASTREATRDSFGSVQQKLYVVDTGTKKLKALDTALTFSLVDWSGNTLAYKAKFRASDGSLKERLGAINAAKLQQVNLAPESTFKAVHVCLNSAVYWQANGELKSVPVAGGTEKALGANVTQLTQTASTVFAFQSSGAWHSYDVNANQVQNSATPASTSRAFLASRSADGQNYLVADTIDGMPTLFAQGVGSGQETKLFAGNGITAPIRWVGNVAVYRVGSADYAASPRGGLPKKITDVSPHSNPHAYPSFN